MTITALSPRPKRRLVAAIAVGLALAFAMETILWAALVPDRGFGELRPAALVLAEMDSLARSGKWEQVNTSVDYEARGRAIVPDLWDAADAPSRARFVDALKTMFRESWEKAHAHPGMLAGTWYELTELAPGVTLIDEVGYVADGEVALRYTFEARGAEHVVVDRRFREDTYVYESTMAIGSTRQRIAAQLGHAPDLREFTANMASWLSRSRTRRIRITPEMLGQE